jgi:ATP-dependent Clp protease ATP-binding subunit ClpA
VARLLEERKMTLEVTPAAKDRIISEGFDPQFGARPMRRAIQRLVQDPLALDLLNGGFSPGDTIVVDAPAGASGLSFAKSAPVETPVEARR